MHFAQPLPDGRKSYSVPKQELRATKCFTTLNVKRAVNEPACDSALEKLRYDLARHLSKSNVKVPVSTENKISGNWVALAMPDTVPSRLNLMTRIASLMTMYSDADSVLLPKNDTCDTFNQLFARDLAQALPSSDDNHQPSERRCNVPIRQTARSNISNVLIKTVLYDLLSSDHSKGLEVLKAWRRYHYNSAIGTSVIETPTTLDEYLNDSTYAFPGKPWMATLRYALGLHLQDIELRAVEPAVEAAMQSVALTRDYWAWSQDSCSVNNNNRLKNAVAISMVEKQCSEPEAMAVVKNAAIAAESEFVECKRDVLEAVGKDHSEVVIFLDAVEHFAAGNSLWCSSCPLYDRRRGESVVLAT